MKRSMESVFAGIHVILHFLVTVLQILTAVENIQISKMYCWLVVIFIIISSLISNSVSVIWVYKGMDFTKRRLGECLCIGLHTFQMGIPWRFLKLCLAGDQNDFHELTIIRLTQDSLQSGPFLVLQTWLALKVNNYSKISLAAMIASLVSMAFTFSSNTISFRDHICSQPRPNYPISQFVVRFIFQSFLMVARFLAFAIFGLLTKVWMILFLIGHFLFTTFIVIIYTMWKTHPQQKPKQFIPWIILQIYGSTFAPVPFSRLSYPYLVYFMVIFLENLVMSTVWFIQSTLIRENVILYTLSLISFFTGFVIVCFYSKIFGMSDVKTGNVFQSRIKVKEETKTDAKRVESLVQSVIDDSNEILQNVIPTSLVTAAPIMTADSLDYLDEVTPSRFFLHMTSIDNALGSKDSGVEKSNTVNELNLDTIDLPKHITHKDLSISSISSGCCADISNQNCKKKPDANIWYNEISKSSTPQLSAIQMTRTERLFIDSLLGVGKCNQNVEWATSSFSQEASNENIALEIHKPKHQHKEHLGMETKADDYNELLEVKDIVESKTGNSKESEESVPAPKRIRPEEINYQTNALDTMSTEQHCSDSDVNSSTYQTISQDLSSVLNSERKLPSLTSSVTRTWADAGLSFSSSSCDTCVIYSESYDGSSTDLSSWSSSLDTMDLLDKDTDCMTWPPRSVKILNLHDLPREKVSVQDRVSKWLGQVNPLEMDHKLKFQTTTGAEIEPCYEVPSELVLARDSVPKRTEMPMKLKRNSFCVQSYAKPKILISSNRRLVRSHSLGFLVKLCNAANYKRKKVVLFNHLREECKEDRFVVS